MSFMRRLTASACEFQKAAYGISFDPHMAPSLVIPELGSKANKWDLPWMRRAWSPTVAQMIFVKPSLRSLRAFSRSFCSCCLQTRISCRLDCCHSIFITIHSRHDEAYATDESKELQMQSHVQSLLVRRASDLPFDLHWDRLAFHSRTRLQDLQVALQNSICPQDLQVTLTIFRLPLRSSGCPQNLQVTLTIFRLPLRSPGCPQDLQVALTIFR